MLNVRQQTVNVNRSELIAALRVNRDAHKAEYEEAVKAYQETVIRKLTETLERAKSGDFKNISIHLAQPESHEKDFTDVIEMMEMSVDETIKLDGEAFRAYFKNEWVWKHSFDTLASTYKLSAGM